MSNNNTTGTEPIVPNTPSLPDEVWVPVELAKEQPDISMGYFVINEQSIDAAWWNNLDKIFQFDDEDTYAKTAQPTHWLKKVSMHEYAAPLLLQIKQLQEENQRLKDWHRVAVSDLNACIERRNKCIADQDQRILQLEQQLQSLKDKEGERK